MEKKHRKLINISIALGIFVIVPLFIYCLGTSFGLFKYEKHGDTRSVVSVSGLKVTVLDNTEDNLDLLNAYPMPDSEGLLRSPIVFNIENTGTSKSIDFTLKLVNDTEAQNNCHVEGTNDPCTVLSANYIRYAYKINNGSYSTPANLGESNNIIFSDTVQGKEVKKVSLVIWIDKEAGNEIQGSYFMGNLMLTGEKGKVTTAKQKILADNEIITEAPTLTTTSQQANENGLYVSYDTNSGDPTYYFRGNVDNNYVDFAGMTWRIVRINEDGTIRLILDQGINDNATYKFNSNANDVNAMYYSNSEAKTTLDGWYTTNITNAGYGDYVATGNYFCEAAKIKYSSSYTSGDATMLVYNDGYVPNFLCQIDGNNKQYTNSNIGLINYDEVLFAGGYYGIDNKSYYLYKGLNADNNYHWWTMSTAGIGGNDVYVWRVISDGYLLNRYANNLDVLRPVINLKANTILVGSGTTTDKYKINTFASTILNDNTLITKAPDLSKTSQEANENGLYVSYDTSTEEPTYYFRGNVNNNYVEFAGMTWRIVRINEDGTVRLILNSTIDDQTPYVFNTCSNAKECMYYSGSLAKTTIETWYQNNLSTYDTYVENGSYCEEARVAAAGSYIAATGADMVVYPNYIPNFKCKNDANDKGIFINKVALVTYDELIFAGAVYSNDVSLTNNSYILNTKPFATMTPAGYNPNTFSLTFSVSNKIVNNMRTDGSSYLRPVINLKADTLITKDVNNHYVVRTTN